MTRTSQIKKEIAAKEALISEKNSMIAWASSNSQEDLLNDQIRDLEEEVEALKKELKALEGSK